MQQILWRIMVLLCMAVVWAGAASPALSDEGQPGETIAPVAEAQEVGIDAVAISLDVVDRMPVASGEVFAREIPRLYCWSRVVGAAEETFVTHNWYHQGGLKASVQLPVRSSNWRTWSAKTMDPELTGEWMVEILSADGTPLESIIFFVQ